VELEDDEPDKKTLAKYRRCLKDMRRELPGSRLEELKEYGMRVDGIQRAVGEFYADFVEDADAFCADPSKWAAELQTNGRAEAANARLEEITRQLDQTWADVEEEDDEIVAWILNGKNVFLAEATLNFLNPLSRILQGDSSNRSQAEDFFRRYGQAAFAERAEPAVSYSCQESEPGRMEPFLGWAQAHLQAYPKWLRLGIEQVALCEKLDSLDKDVESVTGEYEKDKRRVKLSALASAVVTDHEAGHVLNLDPANLNKLDTRLRALFVEAVLAEEARHSLYALETYAKEGPGGGLEEDFAEAWSYFINAPEYLEGVTPKRHAAVAEITQSLKLDVESLRQAAKKAETERLGNAEMARAVFEVYGYDWLINKCRLPRDTYADTRWALPGWRQIQASGRVTDGDDSSFALQVSRDEHGRLQKWSMGEKDPYTFKDPAYDDRGRLTSYQADGLLYFVIYGEDDLPQEVLIDTEFKGAPKTVATFRTEEGKLIQKLLTPEGHVWEFIHGFDAEGQLTEIAVALNGRPVCRRPLEKDAQGRLKSANYLTLDGKLVTASDETKYDYKD